MRAILPLCLNFKSARNLIRVGRKNDGGYLVDADDIKRSKALVSFGINDDWSFEQDFVSMNDSPLWAFDASVGKKVLLL